MCGLLAAPTSFSLSKRQSFLVVPAESLGYDFLIDLYHVLWPWRWGSLVRGEHPDEQTMWNGRGVDPQENITGWLDKVYIFTISPLTTSAFR